MPPDIFSRTLSDGSPNALWSRRANVSNGDFNLNSSVVTLAALQFRNFANSVPGRPSGFGGPVTGLNPGGGDNGGIENLPHNRVHVQIGGNSGFMTDPSTAALDPIFWVHHCNIDGLWEVWRNQGPQFRNPTEADWRSTVPFPMHDGDGQPFTYFSQDMLDTTKVPAVDSLRSRSAGPSRRRSRPGCCSFGCRAITSRFACRRARRKSTVPSPASP
jgi:tyrosinase